MPDRQWQYQIKAEPILVPAVPPLQWYVQPPDPIRVISRPEGGITGGFEPIIPSFGYYIQAGEPVRTIAPHWAPSAEVIFVPPPILLNWYVQLPDPIIIARRQHPAREFRPEGVFPPYEWYVQQVYPIWIIRKPEGMFVEPIEWLFWGWLQELPQPQRKLVLNYLMQTKAESLFRQLFMQPRDWLGF